MHRMVAKLILVLAAAASSGTASSAAAAARQVGDGVAGRAPQFLVADASRSEPARLDVSSTPALRRNLSLEIDDATIIEALAEISRRAGLNLVYSAEELLPAGTRVTLRAEAITVAAALTHVLLDAGVDILFTGKGVVTLVPQPPTDRLPGTIVGRVTEAETDNPIVNAQIAVDGRGRTITDADGRYRINGVAAGRRTVSVTHTGYARVTREADVSDGATVMVDFALEVSPSVLDAVVVTVTGEQRVRELGHVVGQINADSLVREAPVSSISQLLTGRLPGVQVFQSSGIVGGDVQLQVRSPNSVLLGRQPIVIVDGVRYTNTAALDPARGGGPATPSIYELGGVDGRTLAAGRAEVTSPLNDLNPNDIESIEVVKGSSAATLYGTDAANGVIVIRTKRGRPGPARWNVYMRATVTETPDDLFPEQHWGWGTRPDGAPFGSSTSGRFRPSNCTLQRVSAGACVQDSITVFNPLADPDLTIFQSAPPAWEYGLNISGGTPGLRYYVAGSFQEEVGPIGMPRAFADSIAEARGSQLPEEQSRPNALRNLNLRTNLTATVGERVQLQGNLGYARRTNRTMDNTVYSLVGSNGAPVSPWGTFVGTSPDEVFSRTVLNQVDRFFFSGRAEWRPARWLQAHAGGGLDLSYQTQHSLRRRGENLNFDGTPHAGEVGLDLTQQRTASADVGLTASLTQGRVSSRTSLGAQYARSLNEIQMSWGTDLVPGGESVAQANNRATNHVFDETVTLGSYAEQTLGLNNRLFVTAALRMDGASNFGQEYQAALYPKANASWVLSEEPFLPRIPGVDELRLRYAFGASGQQAYGWMKHPSFITPLGQVEGAQLTVIKVVSLGNEQLRPERASEHEFGFDVSGLDNRVHAEFAWYRRRVVDQILNQILPPGLGSIYTNLGLTTARGFEASLAARVLDNRQLSWDVSVRHSSQSTLVVDLGDAEPFVSDVGGFKEGYSLGARFQQPMLGFEDTNGDDIIDASELQWGDTAVYVGETIPPRTQSLSTVVGLFDGRLRVSASFNRTSGHVRAPFPHVCQGGKCLALLDPGTPIAQQAAALGSVASFVPSAIPADETRFAELTAMLEVPGRLIEWLGVRSAMLSVSARNLALWTRYPGDPGSVAVRGIRTDVPAGVPQARSWMFRFDLGF